MDRAAVFPTEAQLENRPYKVVVFDIDDQRVQLAKQSDVGTSVSGELVGHINKSNAVMLDKAGFEGLKKALDAHNTSYKNTSNVDYALTGQISVANHNREYRKATSTTDKYGKVHVTEAYCYYSALVQGNIRIYDAKTMRLAHTIAISGGASNSVSMAKSHARSCSKLTQEGVNSLVRSAGVKAAKRQDVMFKNFFRPKGYVLERRAKGSENIFKISLGKESGILSDQDAVFYSVEEDKHPVTGKISHIQNKVGEGTVTDKIYDKHAWIMVDDKKLASQIKLGDVVKVVYEKSFMDKILNSSYSK